MYDLLFTILKSGRGYKVWKRIDKDTWEATAAKTITATMKSKNSMHPSLSLKPRLSIAVVLVGGGIELMHIYSNSESATEFGFKLFVIAAALVVLFFITGLVQQSKAANKADLRTREETLRRISLSKHDAYVDSENERTRAATAEDAKKAAVAAAVAATKRAENAEAAAQSAVRDAEKAAQQAVNATTAAETAEKYAAKATGDDAVAATAKAATAAKESAKANARSINAEALARSAIEKSHSWHKIANSKIEAAPIASTPAPLIAAPVIEDKRDAEIEALTAKLKAQADAAAEMAKKLAKARVKVHENAQASAVLAAFRAKQFRT